MSSLQDQLLKAGVVDAKKSKKIQKEKRKQAKQQPKGSQQVDETKELAKKSLAEKAARDRKLNQLQQQEAEKKAIQGQIIQLIENHKIEFGNADIPYQFTDNKKIKKIYVTEQIQNQLSKGQIAIAKLRDSYQLVPAAIAEKISQRDETAIVLINSKAEAIDEDDPYADYPIPDDLMW